MSILLTLGVLAAWLCAALALAAIGGACLQRIGRVEPGWSSLYCSIWLGLSLVVLALMLWHFALPVSRAVPVLAVVSAVAVFAGRRWMAPLADTARHWPLAVAILAAAAWSANHSLAPGGMDDYNYEFQAVRWFYEHPLVPGLANLHGRLGFNNSHHLLAALASAGPLHGRANHLVNGFVVSLALAWTLAALAEVLRGRGRTQGSSMFAAALVAPVAGLAVFGIFGPAISTLKADVFVTAGTAVLACLFLQCAGAGPGSSEQRTFGAAALTLAALLVTVKLSAAAFCAILGVATAVQLLRTSRREPLAWFAVATAAGLAAAFIVRGIALSGYPLYPSTVMAAAVDWRVPAAQAAAERTFILTWSQLRPSYDTAAATGYEWLRGWSHSLVLTQKFGIVLPLAILAVLTGGCIPRKRKRDEPDPAVPAWALAVISMAAVAALAVWFTQAPAARFAAVYFWILLAAALAAVMRRPMRVSWASAGVALAIGSAIVLGLLLVAINRAGIEPRHWPGTAAVVLFGVGWGAAWLLAGHRTVVAGTLVAALAVSQMGERAVAHVLAGRTGELVEMFWLRADRLPPRPVFPSAVRKTASGLDVYVAASSAFETPLPNTRYFNPHLELRRPPDLRGGFRSRGGWESPAGYSVDYVMQPGAEEEIVRPRGE